MELEEMQQAWAKLSQRVEKQDILTTQLLEKTTQQSYHSRLNRIKYSELVGTLVCYAAAAYVGVYLTRIEDFWMQVLAVFTIVVLLVLPIVSLASVRAVRSVNISVATYVETIQAFGRQKLRFQRLQKINVLLGLLLLFVSLPVMAAIQGKDLSQIPYLWTVLVPVGVAVFLAFAYWVLRSYNKILSDMENLLTNIEK
jgi:steroid 5-alpha reductase family enzyme